LLKSVVTAYSFRNVTRGIFNLTSDLTTVVILLIGLEYITGKEFLTGGILLALATGEGFASALADMWNQFRQTDEYRANYEQRGSSVLGGLINLFENILGIFTGEALSTFESNQADRPEEEERRPFNWNIWQTSDFTGVGDENLPL
jgi:hypothetical protein